MAIRARPVLAACALGAIVLASAAEACADVVVTVDGKTYEGKVTSQDGTSVVMETTFDGHKEFPRAQVRSVDTTVPPLREQYDYRLSEAKDDLKALNDVADWAKSKGFRKELDAVWKKIVEVDPKNARAHKALGHLLVGKDWMTPEEKEAAEKAAYEASMRAKGLVPHQGMWVTPADKEAMEKGLMKDGAEWVTEDVWHQRRGEKKVDGKWIKVGEAEGLARTKAVAAATGAPLVHLWGPHFDVIHEIKPEDAKAVLDAAEKAFAAGLNVLKPDAKDGLPELRVQVFLFNRSAPYGRFVEFFAKEQEIGNMPGMENWQRSTTKQKAFWWIDPVVVTGHYLFPNPLAVLTSNVIHNLGAILINRYRFNWRFSSQWLSEGFSYFLELEALGSSMSYNIGKGGGGGADPQVWEDTKQWKTALAAHAASGQDTPFSRMAGFKYEQFSLTDLVKAWSVVDYLIKLDAAKFKAFVDGTKEKGSSTEEDAIKAAYGADFRALDATWRSYVKAGFKLP